LNGKYCNGEIISQTVRDWHHNGKAIATERNVKNRVEAK
jgi:hypothetical protein